MDDLNKKRFRLGAILTWAPWIPIAIGFANILHGISKQKATGLGAAAGGLTELFIVWGVGAVFIAQVSAIVLLIRAFAPGHWMRTLFSLVSIGLSGLMLALIGLFLWLSWSHAHPGLS